MRFSLHPTLAADSLPIADTETLSVRLIADARFPWVIVVPKVPDVTDLHGLPDDVYAEAMKIVRILGAGMKEAFAADRINTAAIGNMVPQLHIHIVARRDGDVAWPKPVWGFGTVAPMDETMATARIEAVRRILSAG